MMEGQVSFAEIVKSSKASEKVGVLPPSKNAKELLSNKVDKVLRVVPSDLCP